MGVKAVFLLYEARDGRDGHQAGRALLARLYRQVTGDALPEIALTERGKPYFVDGKWHFSISHTKNFVFCALSDRNIGLDAEEKGRKVTPAMLEKFTSDTEKLRLGDDPQDAFLRLWVLKEAAAKHTGRGLLGYPDHTDFSPYDPRVLQVDGCFVAIITEL